MLTKNPVFFLLHEGYANTFFSLVVIMALLAWCGGEEFLSITMLGKALGIMVQDRYRSAFPS